MIEIRNVFVLLLIASFNSLAQKETGDYIDTSQNMSQFIVEIANETAFPLGTKISQQVNDGSFAGNIQTKKLISTGGYLNFSYVTKNLLESRKAKTQIRFEEGVRFLLRQERHDIRQSGTLNPIGSFEFDGRRSDLLISMMLVQGLRLDFPIGRNLLISTWFRGYFGFNVTNWKSLSGVTNGEETTFNETYKQSSNYRDFIVDNLLWGFRIQGSVHLKSLKGAYLLISLPIVEGGFWNQPAEINEVLFTTQGSYGLAIGIGYQIHLKTNGND